MTGTVLVRLAEGSFFRQQLDNWPETASRYAAVECVAARMLEVKGFCYCLQYNPSRSVSSKAKVDPVSIASRPCFLCARPSEQLHLDVMSSSGNRYMCLVNPYPLSKEHYTVASSEHVPQTVSGSRISDFLEFAESVPSMVWFYNDEGAGASAPDHLHFQAMRRGTLPLDRDFCNLRKTLLYSDNGFSAYSLEYCCGAYSVVSSSADVLASVFKAVYACRKSVGIDFRINLVAWNDGDRTVLNVFFRSRHRPARFYDENDPVGVSPGAADMAGLVVLTDRKDFDRLSSQDVSEIMDEVSDTACEGLIDADFLDNICKTVKKI